MNVQSARVALRDRTLLDVLDLALRFVVAHKGAFATMTACVSLPAFAASWLIASRAGWYWGWTAAIALASLAEAPFVALSSRLVFQESVPVRQALGAGLRALPALFALRLLQALLLSFAAVFFLLPALWIAALFFFAAEVIVLEGSPVGASIGRMQRLGTGYFGDVAMAMLAMVFLYLLAILLGNVALGALLEGILQIRLRPSEDEIGGPLALFALWLALPVLTTARFFVYLNLRTRREGWDIQTRFAALAARAREEAAT